MKQKYTSDELDARLKFFLGLTLGTILLFTTEGARTIYSNTGYFAQNYIANPAQWGALIGAQDTTKRPVFNALQQEPSRWVCADKVSRLLQGN